MTKLLSRYGLLALTLGASGCSLGPTELLIILAIVVLLFGASRLPQLGKALGDTMRSFRQASADDALPSKKAGELDSKRRGEIEDADVEPAERKNDRKS
ncbi:MAG: twin-arginine translocase TatA/TatE family subunit [Deltaproteobacteria bacterium]|nr:twin-arginine translocase TatA/TatE family subunit [Deltaproteobacteria bacterium]